MAEEQQVNALKEQIDKVLEFKAKDLISRTNDWGPINFEPARADIEGVFAVLGHLSDLPVQYLSDNATTEIQNATSEAGDTLREIDNFNIEQAGNASEVRDNLVAEIHNRADALYEVSARWIAFLAYMGGEVAENIGQMRDAVREAGKVLDTAKSDANTKAEEIEAIIKTAREASADAGAAVFTTKFMSEDKDIRKEAKRWLWTTAVLAVATLTGATILVFGVLPPPDLAPSAAVQHVGGKFVFLGILITATIWCGRLYRALRHQAAVNKHRGLSIQSLQAFHNSAADPAAKDAVVLEAARAVYGNTPTGLITETNTSSDGGTRIIEVAKSFVQKGED